jgi:predicted nucleic acid-binding protein
VSELTLDAAGLTADAHVVLCARRSGQPVVTSDPGDLKKIAPELSLIVS